MDDMQLRLLTTQALYGRNLEDRALAIRHLVQGGLTPSNVASLGVRLELALSCQDEYVRSSAALLLDGLAEHIPISPVIAEELLDLSRSPESFTREAALRAIKRACERGHFVAEADGQALSQRLTEALDSEGEGFAYSLFDEG